MIFTVETTPRFEREFKKLDKYTQRMLKAWIEKIWSAAKTRGCMARDLLQTARANGDIE